MGLFVQSYSSDILKSNVRRDDIASILVYTDIKILGVVTNFSKAFSYSVQNDQSIISVLSLVLIIMSYGPLWFGPLVQSRISHLDLNKAALPKVEICELLATIMHFVCTIKLWIRFIPTHER